MAFFPGKYTKLLLFIFVLLQISDVFSATNSSSTLEEKITSVESTDKDSVEDVAQASPVVEVPLESQKTTQKKTAAQPSKTKVFLWTTVIILAVYGTYYLLAKERTIFSWQFKAKAAELSEASKELHKEFIRWNNVLHPELAGLEESPVEYKTTAIGHVAALVAPGYVVKSSDLQAVQLLAKSFDSTMLEQARTTFNLFKSVIRAKVVEIDSAFKLYRIESQQEFRLNTPPLDRKIDQLTRDGGDEKLLAQLKLFRESGEYYANLIVKCYRLRDVMLHYIRHR